MKQVQELIEALRVFSLCKQIFQDIKAAGFLIHIHIVGLNAKSSVSLNSAFFSHGALNNLMLLVSCC